MGILCKANEIGKIFKEGNRGLFVHCPFKVQVKLANCQDCPHYTGFNFVRVVCNYGKKEKDLYQAAE